MEDDRLKKSIGAFASVFSGDETANEDLQYLEGMKTKDGLVKNILLVGAGLLRSPGSRRLCDAIDLNRVSAGCGVQKVEKDSGNVGIMKSFCLRICCKGEDFVTCDMS